MSRSPGWAGVRDRNGGQGSGAHPGSLKSVVTPSRSETVRGPLHTLARGRAGVGETVFFVRGKEASFPFHPIEVPADAGIVGIVDHWDVEKPAGL